MPLAKDSNSYQSQAVNKPKLLSLAGEKGTVACQVHQPSYAELLPKAIKPWHRLKYAWLSEEKMRNLTVVRGTPNAYMVGPTNYYGDLDRSDLFHYTLDISDAGAVKFNEHSLDAEAFARDLQKNQPVPDELLTKVKAKWYSGKHLCPRQLAEYNLQNTEVFGGNLFSKSGILEVDALNQPIKLASFDPRNMDLSKFKARLVPNNKPFQITSHQLNIDDEYCAVSYEFAKDYAEDQVKNGAGLFLETHQFAQTMTPLNEHSKGYVTLAKWNLQRTELELIAVQIPFGYTLIIEEDCIHGDVTLSGSYMMCMTSDHVSMATADTVFLKNASTKSNIELSLDTMPDHIATVEDKPSNKPLVFFHQQNEVANFAQFKESTRGMDFIFTPFNLGFWQVQQELIGTLAVFALAAASLSVAVCLFESMLLLSITAASASVALSGFGLFRTINCHWQKITESPVTEPTTMVF